VHGDLKTLNILLTRNWAVAKLGDVGVARYLKAKDVPDHVACALLKPVHTKALSSSQCPGCGVCDAESAAELLHMQLDCVLLQLQQSSSASVAWLSTMSSPVPGCCNCSGHIRVQRPGDAHRQRLWREGGVPLAHLLLLGIPPA